MILTYAWGTMGMRESSEAPTLWVKMQDHARKLSAAKQEIAELRAKLEAAQKDAERYRWLRVQHWSENEFCVVRFPRASLKLGAECPSFELLDAAIDAEREVK